MAQGKFLGRGVAQPTDTCGTLFNKTGWLSPAVFGHFRVGVLYDAIEEELKALPSPPARQSARVHHVAVVEALPKPFVGASRLPNRESLDPHSRR